MCRGYISKCLLCLLCSTMRSLVQPFCIRQLQEGCPTLLLTFWTRELMPQSACLLSMTLTAAIRHCCCCCKHPRYVESCTLQACLCLWILTVLIHGCQQMSWWQELWCSHLIHFLGLLLACVVRVQVGFQMSSLYRQYM